MANITGQAFEKLFTDWFGGLHTYAFALLKDEAEAEEVVQELFCRLWERRETFPEPASVKAYLYGCVHHACIDQMRRRKSVRVRKMERSLDEIPGVQHVPGMAFAGDAAQKLELAELQTRFERALQQLPEKCRNIYQLSRFGELRYREIAEQLGIAEKTVEAQMSKAIKHLRKELADHL